MSPEDIEIRKQLRDQARIEAEALGQRLVPRPGEPEYEAFRKEIEERRGKSNPSWIKKGYGPGHGTETPIEVGLIPFVSFASKPRDSLQAAQFIAAFLSESADLDQHAAYEFNDWLRIEQEAILEEMQNHKNKVLCHINYENNLKAALQTVNSFDEFQLIQYRRLLQKIGRYLPTQNFNSLSAYLKNSWGKKASYTSFDYEAKYTDKPDAELLVIVESFCQPDV